jgi:hypothetical protein
MGLVHRLLNSQKLWTIPDSFRDYGETAIAGGKSEAIP